MPPKAPDLFRTLSKTKNADEHQAVADAWAWGGELLLSPASPSFDADFDTSFDTNTRMVLDCSASCPWRVHFVSPLLAVRAIPGRGLGLVATAAIPRDTLLLHEEGAVGTRECCASWLAVTGGRASPQDAPLCGSTSTRLESWSPYRNVSREAWNLALCQLRENKFTLAGEGGDDSDSEGGGGEEDERFVIFALASRINHSCSPSGMRHMHDDPSRISVFARRDLEEGEELTMRYSAEEGHGACTEFFSCDCGVSLRERARASSKEATLAKELHLRQAY